MTNKGIAPLDPDSNVGQFRLLLPDAESVPLDPPEAGYGDYAEVSDTEIEMYLATAQDSVPRAIGVYYGILAGQAAKAAKNVKDHDLSVNTEKRAADLRATAQWWFDRADAVDDAAGLLDIFDVFDVPGSDLPAWSPEAAPSRVVTF